MLLRHQSAAGRFGQNSWSVDHNGGTIAMSEFQIVASAFDGQRKSTLAQLRDLQLRVCAPIYLDEFADVSEVGIRLTATVRF